MGEKMGTSFWCSCECGILSKPWLLALGNTMAFHLAVVSYITVSRVEVCPASPCKSCFWGEVVLSPASPACEDCPSARQWAHSDPTLFSVIKKRSRLSAWDFNLWAFIPSPFSLPQPFVCAVLNWAVGCVGPGVWVCWAFSWQWQRVGA